MSEPTKTYTGVLNQLAVITFGYMCACVWLLCEWAPELKIGPIIAVNGLGVSIPAYWLGGVVLAAFVFRLTKLHDRISDWFGLRKRYDYTHIISPLYIGSKPNAPLPPRNRIIERRHKIMRSIFYRYTRVEGDGIIDGHFVEMAWESLRWFWAIVEALAVTVFFVVFCVIAGEMRAASMFGLLLLLLIILYPIAKKHCILQTANEVAEILSDPARQNEISQSFDEVLR
jgi:hypothetical protein